MCGHFIMVVRDELEAIVSEIALGNHVNVMPDWPARRVDAYPQSIVPLIVADEGNFAIEEKQWGFTVPWKSGVIINARSETAASETGMWRDSLLNRRCIVPAYGFFEPHATEMSVSERTGRPVKRQYLFEGPRRLLFMAGIYQNDRFSLMTTAPNASVAPIHDRMPVVLLEHELHLWLSPDFPTLYDRTGIELSVTPQGPLVNRADALSERRAPQRRSTVPPGQEPLWSEASR